MNQVLVDGLVQLCKAKPVGNDAVRWLGEWLVANNPARPVGGGATTSTTSSKAIASSAPSAPSSVIVTAPSLPVANFPGGMTRAQYVNGAVVVVVPEAPTRTIVFRAWWT